MVSIFGGLGNQMFQYATAKALALKLGVELKLDITHVIDRTPRKNFTFRDFELTPFYIEDEVANLQEVRKFIPNLWKSNELIKHYFKLKRQITGLKLYREKQKFSYNNEFDGLKDNTYIYGYFQTEDYFKNIRPEILKRFSLKEGYLNDENSKLLNEITTRNSISIHIRRGDYENSIFELLSIDSYYRKAIDLIKEKVDSPVFYIFSNDSEWAEENFGLLEINNTIVTLNSGSQSYLDMMLMSNCKHNICANSSFSWWGAWLNQNSEKVVIVPEKWYKSGNYAETTYNLIPKEWIKIS
jgi:hypothetical protein